MTRLARRGGRCGGGGRSGVAVKPFGGLEVEDPMADAVIVEVMGFPIVMLLAILKLGQNVAP